MKKYAKYILSLMLIGLFVAPAVFAGNKQRIGQAGASELLINPWAGTSGWADANSGSVRGLESFGLNVAGTALVNKTEIGFHYPSNPNTLHLESRYKSIRELAKDKTLT